MEISAAQWFQQLAMEGADVGPAAASLVTTLTDEPWSVWLFKDGSILLGHDPGTMVVYHPVSLM